MVVHSHSFNPNPSLHATECWSYAVGLTPVLRKSSAGTPSDLSVCNLQTWRLREQRARSGRADHLGSERMKGMGDVEPQNVGNPITTRFQVEPNCRRSHVCTSATCMIQTSRFRRSARTGLGAARTGAAHLPSPGQCNDKFPPRTRLERHRCALRHSWMLEVTRWRAPLLTWNFWRYSLHSRIDTADRGARPEKSSTPLSPPKNDKRCARYILAKRL